MKKNILKSAIAIFAVFGFSSALYSQDKNERLPRFTYDVGFGTNVLSMQNLSPWGIHYRGNFNRGFSFYGQVNYIFQNGRLLGFKIDGFGGTANYTLTSNERVAENNWVLYFAPQWGWVRNISPRILWSSHMGVGYALFQSDGLLDDTQYRIHSHMMGGNVDFSLAYLLGQNISVGLSTSISGMSSFGEQHRNIGDNRSTFAMDEMNRIGLLRMDFSLFWRVQF